MNESSDVCVIGGGPGGILSVKYCLEYNLSVICYETRSCYGGIWSASQPGHRTVDSELDPRQESCVGVHDGLNLNSSQFTSTYSDFPMPEDLLPSRHGNGRYLSAAQFLEYLKRYVACFKVEPHIRLNTRVVNVRRANAEDGPIFRGRRWAVTVRQEDGEVYTTFHKHVIMATGVFSQAKIPEFEGMSESKTKILHTGHLRNTREAFQGKRVLVIGGSISSFDIGQVALRAEAEQVIHAAMRSDPTKRNIYLLHRIIPGMNLAWDEFYTLFGVRYFTSAMKDRLLQKLSVMVHKSSPDARIDRSRDSIGVIDDANLTEAIGNGQYKLIPYTVDRFVPNSNKVILKNGEAYEIDTCMMSTGFSMKYPFLDAEVQASDPNSKENLHRLMVSTTKEAWGLIYLYSSCILGNGLITTEIEARWVVHNIAKGNLEPDESKRLAAIRNDKPAPYYSSCEPLCYELIDDLAKDMGCEPSMWPAFFHPCPSARRIGLANLWGPWLSHMYRLRGPHHKHDVASKAILKIARELIGWKFDAVALGIDVLHIGAAVGIAYGTCKWLSSRGYW